MLYVLSAPAITPMMRGPDFGIDIDDIASKQVEGVAIAHGEPIDSAVTDI
jgi:hypothetical protein